MGLEATLQILNELQAVGAMKEYAIGGAVAAFLYIEPGTTFDLDVFIAWKPGPGGLLTPMPLHEELAKRGYRYEKEAILIEGWAVQFLPAGDSLIEEALRRAVSVVIKSVPTKVFSKEHLMAICLQTGRPKDLARLAQFLEESEPDMKRFEKIVERHKLSERWEKYKASLGPP
ncbi:MAG: hypothetical protein ABSE62_04525 [Chthoniobacteraceae bacterium]|jgi:hypothetical protein